MALLKTVVPAGGPGIMIRDGYPALDLFALVP
jgi:hypothetical protein